MTDIEIEWNKFAESVLPGSPAPALEIAKRMFFAGAFQATRTLIQRLGDGDPATDADIASKLKKLHLELKDVCMELGERPLPSTETDGFPA